MDRSRTLKTLRAAAAALALLATTAHAQTTYSSTLPTMQGYTLTSWTPFTFTNTPNTTGGATLTFSWLACYQGGFAPDYPAAVRRVVRQAFARRADAGGQVTLRFRRVFLLARAR